MRLVLDNLIFSWQRSGGISVVWNELLKGVLEASDIQCQILEYRGAEQHNVMRRTLSIPHAFLRVLSPFGLVLKRYLNGRWCFKGGKQEPFIFHSSYYRYSTHPKAINVVTVHDFTYERFVKSPALLLHRWQKSRALRAADAIVCISECTKADLLTYYPEIDPKRIRVIYNGVSEVYQPIPTEPSGSEEMPYLLFIGSRADYKRFDIAVATASHTGLKLAIVGAPLNHSEHALIDKYQIQWHHYGFLEEVALRDLYAKAVALIYASEYEGFGIPVIEAQRCGCPVIACAVSSIPEVIGDYPILLSKPDAVEASKYIMRLLDEPEFKQKVVTLGFENAKRFSWALMRKEYLQLYREIWSLHQRQ